MIQYRESIVRNAYDRGEIGTEKNGLSGALVRVFPVTEDWSLDRQ